MSSARVPEQLHPIRVVVKRTGLSADVLRVWERRYKAVEPVRTDGDRRLYSDADIERLLLLRRVTDAGRSIGQVAGLDTSRLKALADADAAAGAAAPVARAPRAATGPSAHAAPPDAARLLAAALDAVRALDGPALDEVLHRARLAMPAAQIVEGLLAPLLHRIGEEWRDGHLRISHEHAATAVVRAFLTGLIESARAPEDAPVLLVATPTGQIHELGALMAAATAAAEGWRVLYLGVGTPAEEIGAAAVQGKARAVALSIVHPQDDVRLHDELRRLRRSLPAGTPVLAGGSGAGGYAATLKECGFSLIEKLPDMRRSLERARAAG